MNSNKSIQKELADILKFKNDAEKLEFEVDILHLDIMDAVYELMKNANNMKPSELADRLDVSASYISQLFSGDKKINLKILARLQRIFNVRFKLDIKKKHAEQHKTYNTYIIQVNATNHVSPKSESVYKDGNVEYAPSLPDNAIAAIN